MSSMLKKETYRSDSAVKCKMADRTTTFDKAEQVASAQRARDSYKIEPKGKKLIPRPSGDTGLAH